jgi:hypothetical protein
MVPLPQDVNPSELEQFSGQRKQNHQVHNAYLYEMKNAHAEGREAKHVVRTNEQGIIIGLHSKWHGAVKALAKREIDYKLRNYNEHPLSWTIVFNNIQNQLNKMFIFEHTEVAEGYMEKYLKHSHSKEQHKWHKHWVMHRQRHEKCPIAYFNTCRDSEEGYLESQLMSQKRTMGKDTFAAENNVSPPTTSTPSS